METYNVQVKWVPGHCKVEGNKRADKLAKEGVKRPPDSCADPTVAGIRAMARIRLQTFEAEKWRLILSKLSRQYRAWELDLTQGCPVELYLSRKELHRLLAIRTRHRDFSWYHMKFKHQDVGLHCGCGRLKTPGHLVQYRKALASSSLWS